MQNLIKQEQFEMEVLDFLNSNRFLNVLVFCGGTMLRLCYGLNRFSVDLDFWLLRKVDVKGLYESIKKSLDQRYTISDTMNKFYTMLYEIKSPEYPRSLKIEIRKTAKKIKLEKAIAFSKYINYQILVNVPSLKDMMNEKITAFLSRREIRDLFDIEFLLKKGIELPEDKGLLRKMLNSVVNLPKKDYTVKLGSLLEENERKYYIKENFKFLKLIIEERLGGYERDNQH